MARFEVDVDVQRALNKIERYSAEAQKRVKAQIQKSVYQIASDARKLAPVDTGNLRSSITGSSNVKAGFAGTVSTNVDYAAFVEFGTRKSPAQPFMFPAAESERPLFEEGMRRAVRE